MGAAHHPEVIQRQDAALLEVIRLLRDIRNHLIPGSPRDVEFSALTLDFAGDALHLMTEKARAESPDATAQGVQAILSMLSGMRQREDV